MARQPEGLLRAANYFWERDWEGIAPGLYGYSDPSFDEKYRMAIEGLIKKTFTIIVDCYGDDAATDLYQWAQRLLVNQHDACLWFTWYLLLSSLGRPKSESQFQTEIARFAGPLEEEFGTATYEADMEALSRIDSEKLSPTEYKMIALEVTQPGDFETVDLRDLAGNVVDRNHAYRFWQILSNILNPSEWDTWLWIGYEQAERLGMPADEVELPVLR